MPTMNSDSTIIEDGEPMEPAEYAYLWINGCCPLHQWCSGGRPVDQEILDYVETRIVEPVRRGSPRWTSQDLANVEALLGYLKANLGTTTEEKDGSFHDGDMRTVTYSEVGEAQQEPFPFSVVGDDAVTVVQALAMGIDAHLEACFVEARGDRCTSHRVAQIATLNDQPVGMPLCGQKPRRLSLILSPASLPVLLRRLFEHDFGGDEEIQDAARSLGQSMLDCIRHLRRVRKPRQLCLLRRVRRFRPDQRRDRLLHRQRLR